MAILHAFHQPFRQVRGYVCSLPARAQRCQPVDHGVIEDLGSRGELQALVRTAHGCGVKVIADVVFNHMADLDGRGDSEDVGRFPGLRPEDVQGIARAGDPPGRVRRPCRDTDSRVDGRSGYDDGHRDSELGCWLGTLPELRFTANVQRIQKAHLRMLLDLGIDGFRFDAAKHIPPAVLAGYVAFVNQASNGRAWTYLEVIEDGDTPGELYNGIAAITDFRLSNGLRPLFSFASCACWTGPP